MRMAGAGALALSIVACAPERGVPDEPIRASRAAVTYAWGGFLDPISGDAFDHVGTSVALWGDRALVGVPFDEQATIGAVGRVGVFDRASGSWQQLQALDASDPTLAASFGEAVDLGPATALVGAPGVDAAYVFVDSGGSLVQEQKLVPSGLTLPGEFGRAVSLDGDAALVGAWADESERGAAYVFVRSGSSWAQEARLVALDSMPGQWVGFDVALDGDLAFASAPPTTGMAGAVYVFQKTAGTWAQAAKLQSPLPQPNDRFGTALARFGSSLLISCPAQAAVYEFRQNAGGAWIHQATISAPQPSTEFGTSLAGQDDVLLVGDPGAQANIGRVYVLIPGGPGWTLGVGIDPPDPGQDTRFGASVAVSLPRVAVGAPLHAWSTPGSERGVAYGFALGLGVTCTTDAMCPTGHCTDGVCCDSECSAPCQTCLIAFGAPQDGTCGPKKEGTGALACGAYACDGSSISCPSSCENSLDCVGPSYCDPSSSQCLPQKLLGQPCSADYECHTGICSDGVCCTLKCDGCYGCRKEVTGEPSGECAPLFAGIDPNDFCDTDPGFPSSCLADGQCDGAGQCRPFAPKTTPCGPTTCKNFVVAGMLCNGAGVCTQGSQSCGTYLCEADACFTSCTSTANCSIDGYCSSAGTCEARQPVGTPCESHFECQSHFCVDGYCCNNSCAGQCEWCGDPLSPGTCLTVIGKPPPGKPPCAASPSGDVCNVPQCDGIDPFACAGFPGSSVVCRAPSCAEGQMLTEARCDGAGSCPSQQPIPCGEYACGATACNQTCASSDDCAPGISCDIESGKCSSAPTCDGDHTLEGPSGQTDCWPFRCSEAGACFTACGSSTQCVADHYCASSGLCEPREPLDDGASCACRSVGSQRSPAPVFALFLLALVGVRKWGLQLPRQRR